MGFGDPTYGRESLPFSESERVNIHDNPNVKVTRRRVYMSGNKPVLDLQLDKVQEALPFRYGGQRITGFIHYYIWEMPEVAAQANVNGDVYLVHGINEYGGRGAPQGLVHMGNGFRVIAIDMPSFGRSSGLHAYLPSMRLNEGTLDAVMYHVHMFDKAQGLPNLDQRKRFAQGHSMGGFTVAYHAALHPPASAPHFLALDGIGMLAPMLQIAPESRPPMALDLIARVVSCFAGRLGVLRAIRGKLSDDPKVEYFARNDIQGYHGLVRVDTGLAIIRGLDHLQSVAEAIQCPVTIHHGTHDRVTDPNGSQDFYKRMKVTNKALRMWPGWEHGTWPPLFQR